jgi:hypothetical protein
MNAAEALRAARMAGVVVRIEDGGLALEAKAQPPAEILELLARDKAGVVALLRAANRNASAAKPATPPDSYWRDWYQERAAIRQFDAGYRREDAERLAFGEVVEAWCRAHPIEPHLLRCAGCGKPLEGMDILDLPDGAIRGPELRLPDQCGGQAQAAQRRRWPSWGWRRPRVGSWREKGKMPTPDKSQSSGQSSSLSSRRPLQQCRR